MSSKKIVSIKKNTEFRRLYNRGAYAVSPTLVIYASKNRLKYPRLGLTAGKKVGCAARRNRAKRRLRELFRSHVLGGKIELHRGGIDFVAVARAACVSAPYEKIERDFAACMKKVLKRL